MKIAAFALLGISFFVLTACAATEDSRDLRKNGTYSWLHPKFGFVKVDRATNSIVAHRKAVAQASERGMP